MTTGSPPGEVAREISCAWEKLSDVRIALGAEVSILACETSERGRLGAIRGGDERREELPVDETSDRGSR